MAKLEADLRASAFVLMPFKNEFDDVYKLGILAAAEGLNVHVSRVDEQSFRGSILERIYNQIGAADFLIADMSGQNPNVFYEVGYAHARDKKVILLSHSSSDIPFDLKHHRHVIYESVSELKEKLTVDIESVLSELESEQATPFELRLKSCFGSLARKDHVDVVELSIWLELENVSQTRSGELDVVTFYTGPGQTLTVGGVRLLDTDSQRKGFSSQHLFSPGIRRLGSGKCLPIRVIAEKIVWYSWDGRDRQEEYDIKGVLLVDLQTSDGSFEWKFEIDVTCAEIPF